MAQVELQEKVTDRTAFTPEVVLRQAQIQDAAVAPDGATIAYSRRVIESNSYVTNLWLTPWTGGESRQITFATANDTAPAFSPDGRMLLFISDRGGRKQPWILPLDGGEVRLAADVPGNTSAARWSPDGRRLLIVAASGVDRLTVGDPDDPTARVIEDFTWRLDTVGFRNQLASAWVAALDGDSDGLRRVSDPEWEILDARWMPDGQRIAVVADAEPDAGMRRRCEQAAAWSLAVRGDDAPRLLASLPGGVTAVRPGPHGEAIALAGHEHLRQPSWSDNHLFVSDGPGVRRLGADLDRPVESVTTGDLLVRGAKLSCEWLDERTILAQVGDVGRTLPYRFDVPSGVAEPLISDEIVCNQIAIGGGRVAIVATERGGATEVYALEEGTMRPLDEQRIGLASAISP